LAAASSATFENVAKYLAEQKADVANYSLGMSLQAIAKSMLALRGITKPTPEQIAAIEPYLADRNDVAIASLLPPKVTVVSTPIGIGTILATLAPNGGAFLDALEMAGVSDPNVKWALKLKPPQRSRRAVPRSKTQQRGLTVGELSFWVLVALCLVFACWVSDEGREDS
jgi:hypothetical protein